jgi:hypothetical protein
MNIAGKPTLWALYVGLNWRLLVLIVARYGTSRLTGEKSNEYCVH